MAALTAKTLNSVAKGTSGPRFLTLLVAAATERIIRGLRRAVAGKFTRLDRLVAMAWFI